MAITPKCERCLKELEDYGALMFSPPDSQNKVRKVHICKKCYHEILKLGGIKDEI